MAAQVDVQKTTGASADNKTVGSAVGDTFYFLSADTIGSPSSNTVEIPSAAGSTGRSYECWFSFEITGTAPPNQVDTFKIWSAYTPDAGSDVFIGIRASGDYVTPTSAASTYATGALTLYDETNKFDLAGTLSVAGDMTSYFPMQLALNTNAVAGDMGNITINYQFNES